MIAIVDGGSTKCDWVILENDGTEVLKTETVGFNPNIIKAELIAPELEKIKLLQSFRIIWKISFFMVQVVEQQKKS
jgi:hypothetical protein